MSADVPNPEPALRAGLERNLALVCAFRGLTMALFPMAVITLFYRRDIGMSMAEILLLQGVFGLAMVLFEFPSGYLADRIGYRRTLVVASALGVVGWGLYVTAGSFLGVVAAEAVLGVSMSLISGTDLALLYESLRETGREPEYARWSGRYQFFGQSAEGAAALLAGLLYAFEPRSPFVVQMGIWGANLLIALLLTEPLRHRPELADSWKQVKGLVRHALVGDPRLRAIFALAIALGMASFVPVWTIQTYAVDGGLPEAWLGPMWSVANFLVAFGALASHRVERRFGFRGTMMLCIALIAAGYLGLGLVHAVWAFGFYFVLTLMRGIYMPLVNHHEQRLVPSSDRAGLLSLRSFFFRGLFFLLCWPVGAGIDRFGQRPVLLVLGAAITLASIEALRRWTAEHPKVA